MRPHTTHGTGTACAFAGTLIPGCSCTTGSSTTTSRPSDDRPWAVATRNSRTPGAASLAAVTLSPTLRTAAGGGFSAGPFGMSALVGGGGLSGTTSARTPVPSTRTL